jgi:hypothetical protein
MGRHIRGDLSSQRANLCGNKVRSSKALLLRLQRSRAANDRVVDEITELNFGQLPFVLSILNQTMVNTMLSRAEISRGDCNAMWTVVLDLVEHDAVGVLHECGGLEPWWPGHLLP